MNMEVIMRHNTTTDSSVATEAIIEDVALNIINENDGSYDLTTTTGMQSALDYAVAFYATVGIQLDADEVNKVVRHKLKTLHELNLT